MSPFLKVPERKSLSLRLCVLVAGLCPTLWDPMNRSLLSSSVHGILQARILVWVKVKVKLLSGVQLFATPWTVAYQAPLSMEFSRQEYRSGLPFPSPEDLPNPGIKPRSPALQADSLPAESPGKPMLTSF